MKWDESMACGIKVIDEEHEALVERVAALGDGGDPVVVAELLDFLGEYVVKHFTHEQVMHRKYLFPGAPSHKEMHDRFITVYTSLRREYQEKGHQPDVLAKLVKTCWLWLRQHIMGMDRDFAAFYMERSETSRLHVKNRDMP